MSKVKFFHCHKHGHFATNCPQNKKNKKVVGVVAGESLASQFELEFSLIACMVSSALGSVWYFDSGTSFKMITLEVCWVKTSTDQGMLFKRTHTQPHLNAKN